MDEENRSEPFFMRDPYAKIHESVIFPAIDDEIWLQEIAMLDYTPFPYSKNQVRKAGQRLKLDLPDAEEQRGDIEEIFRIAHSWRASHATPMRSVLGSLGSHMRRAALPGVTASRLKRMTSIRSKLRSSNINLERVQDIAGCRAIVGKMEHVQRLTKILRQTPPQNLERESPYIDAPRASGYRSHHMVFKFEGRGSQTVFNGRQVEVQLRTNLQHSWATAVEAAGLLIGNNLKSGQGDERWLRLMLLMSAEFAAKENCPAPDGVPGSVLRRREIRNLNQELNAFKALNDFRYVVRDVGVVSNFDDRPEYYLVEYDKLQKTVRVTPKFNKPDSYRDYRRAEQEDTEDGKDIVLIETARFDEITHDKLESLKMAYPNYFGDVRVFCEILAEVVGTDATTDYQITTLRSRRQHAPKPDRRYPVGPGRRRIWMPK